jgi:hypothetical protein
MLPDIPLRSLASRLDVARLVADGHIVDAEDDGPDAQRSSSDEEGRVKKRARFATRALSSTSAPGKAEALSPERHSTKAAVPRPKGDLARTFGDPVDLGVCSDAEGRKLVELYVPT